MIITIITQVLVVIIPIIIFNDTMEINDPVPAVTFNSESAPIPTVAFDTMSTHHLPELWKILADYPEYFDDTMNIKSLDDLNTWFAANVIEGIVAIDKNNSLAGCGYLDLIHNRLGRLNIIFKKKVIPMKLILNILVDKLNYFVDKYNLDMIYGVTRTDNRACLMVLSYLGFLKSDYLPDHELINGVYKDCWLMTFMKHKL